MDGFISYLGHLGIVRVLTVPGAIAVLVYLSWLLAAPPEDRNSDTERGRNA